MHPIFLGDHTSPRGVHPLRQPRAPPRPRKRSNDALGGPPRDGPGSRLLCFLCGRCWIEGGVDLDRRATSRLLNGRGRSCPYRAPPSCHSHSECRAAATVFADPLLCRVARRASGENSGPPPGYGGVELGDCSSNGRRRGRSNRGENAKRASARGRDREQHEAQRHASPAS